MSEHVRQISPFRWEGIEVKPYKGEGVHFAGVTRQVLFTGGDGLGCELRYFEVAPGGWSSLERHQHAHAEVVAVQHHVGEDRRAHQDGENDRQVHYCAPFPDRCVITTM